MSSVNQCFFLQVTLIQNCATNMNVFELTEFPFMIVIIQEWGFARSAGQVFLKAFNDSRAPSPNPLVR